MTNELKKLFQQHFDEPVKKISELPAHGSNRTRYRLVGKTKTAIGVFNENFQENTAFIVFAEHFLAHNLPVPQVYAKELQQNIYIEEDLGAQTLFDFLQQERNANNSFSDELVAVYHRVAQWLPAFQINAGKTLNYNTCYPRHSFDRQSISWDLNYFKYYFLKLAGISFNEQKLEDDFTRFTDFLLKADHDYFLYRDFQSRNIMLRDGEPYFIDFQGGRRGALQYDIASLLYDAKADLPFSIRESLLKTYLESVRGHIDLSEKSFMEYYPAYVLVRVMQAMGAYGFRGFYERKTHFLRSVPYAIRNLEYILSNSEIPIQIPTLRDCLQAIVRSTRLRELSNANLPLVVRIESFSYKNGLPVDESGHGGGFVFDCRSLSNPGRQEQYKLLTGNDASVISFLEKEPEVHAFLTHIKDLIIPVIEKYNARNFTQLSIHFGCTGGQHRSVYCANQLADFLKTKFQLKVDLHHREKERWPQQ